MIETLRQIDLQLFHFVNQTIANPVLDICCPVLRANNFLIYFYILLGFGIYRLYPKDYLKIFIAGALTFLLTDQLSSSLIKPFFHRIRPCNDSHVMARLIIEHCGSGFSFVSAHAANSFGMVALISSLPVRRKQSILALGIWASLVSFSQVYVGVHYPADVIAGAILGIAIGATTGVILKAKFDFNNHSSIIN